MTTDSILLSAKALLDAGDEEGVRALLVKHIHELPEELRNQLITFFFAEAVTRHAEGVRVEDEFIADSLNALDELGELRALLEEQIALAHIRNNLNMDGA